MSVIKSISTCVVSRLRRSSLVAFAHKRSVIPWSNKNVIPENEGAPEIHYLDTCVDIHKCNILVILTLMCKKLAWLWWVTDWQQGTRIFGPRAMMMITRKKAWGFDDGKSNIWLFLYYSAAINSLAWIYAIRPVKDGTQLESTCDACTPYGILIQSKRTRRRIVFLIICGPEKNNKIDLICLFTRVRFTVYLSPHPPSFNRRQ